MIFLFFFRFSILDGKAFTQHPFPLSSLTSLPCIFQQFNKNICCAVFLLLSLRWRKIFNKFLIFIAGLGFLLLFTLKMKNHASAHFLIPPMYGTWKFFFYWVELNIILLFLISENCNFSAHCTLYFRTEGVYDIVIIYIYIYTDCL